MAGVSSTLAPSFARTRNSCGPAARPVYSAGELQELKVAASSAHSKDAPASLDEKVKLALVLAVELAGPVSTVVSGARSIVQEWTAALPSVLPAASVARTRRTWSPSERPLYSAGVVQVE